MDQASLGSGSQGQTITDLIKLYCIEDDDLARVRSVGAHAAEILDGLVEEWYAWLRSTDDFPVFFPDDKFVRQVQEFQRKHWEATLEATLDDAFLQRCVVVGETHARIGLPLQLYVAGVNTSLSVLARAVDKLSLAASPSDTLLSLNKLINLEMAIIVETYTRIVNDKTTSQARALMELSTPVTQIWPGILLLPVVGLIDSKRAEDIMTTTLSKIADTQARRFILDISGVGIVDTAVANHLIKISKASRLMGCESTISGVSPAIAQTIVELGIDVGNVSTTATMKDALAEAFEQTGIKIVVKG